jgi:hypothetical protein
MKEYKVKVYSDRTEWCNLGGQLHREDEPAIEWANGDKSYYLNGKRHRENGPAVEIKDGFKFYYINDKRHREDGPAMEYENGHKDYYINDKELTEEEFNNRNKSCIDKIVEIEGVKYKLTKV